MDIRISIEPRKRSMCGIKAFREVVTLLLPTLTGSLKICVGMMLHKCAVVCRWSEIRSNRIFQRGWKQLRVKPTTLQILSATNCEASFLQFRGESFLKENSGSKYGRRFPWTNFHISYINWCIETEGRPCQGGQLRHTITWTI